MNHVVRNLKNTEMVMVSEREGCYVRQYFLPGEGLSPLPPAGGSAFISDFAKKGRDFFSGTRRFFVIFVITTVERFETVITLWKPVV